MRLVSLVLATSALPFATSARGQNSSVVINQIGTAEGLATVHSEGRANKVTVVQGAPGATSHISVRGSNNSVNVSQGGASSDQVYAMLSSDSSRLSIDQNGSGGYNIADVSVRGAGNSAAIFQSASNGAPNIVNLDQNGARNEANLSQSGAGNNLALAQTGNNNSANLAQTGSNLGLSITETGSQSVSISQH